MNGTKPVHYQQIEWTGIKAALQWLATALAAFWYWLPPFTQLLFWMMLADTLLGIALAIRNRRISAKAVWMGATKKSGALILVGVGIVLDIYVDFGVNLGNAASAYYVLAELFSIARNAGLLGVKMFPGFDRALEFFAAFNEEDKKRD